MAMRWLDNDPDGNSFYNRNLPAKSKKWQLSDFNLKGQEVFNYHFIHARMTYWELTYLHSLIEEFKDVEVHPYRKLEIWRALNWAPTPEQFAFVIPTNFYKNAQKFVDDIYIKTDLDTSYKKSFKGFWVEPFNESLITNSGNTWLGYDYNADDTPILEYYDISPKKPSQKPNYEKSKMRSVVPAFVLDREIGKWNGTIPGRDNKIQNPFEVDKDGNIIKFNSLDSVIRAKIAGYKYKGKEIPDQEIVHYIRRKYGFGHAVPNQYNIDSGLPYAHWYVIPFFDDEPNKCLNLGEYRYGGSGELDSYNLVDKSFTMEQQDRTTTSLWEMIKEDYGGFVHLSYRQLRYYTNDLVSVLVDRNHKKFKDNNYLTSWNQIFHFSTIRAHWRAAKILEEISKFASYVADGIDKGTVLTVAAEIGPDSDVQIFDNTLKSMYAISEEQLLNNPNIINTSSRQPKKSIVFISGKKEGNSSEKHHSADPRLENLVTARFTKESKSYQIRPWNDIFHYSAKGENAFASDRFVHSNGECGGEMQYMRNILVPNISPYLSDVLYDTKQILYTKKAVNQRACFYKPLLAEMFNSNGIQQVEKFFSKNFIEKPLETSYANIYKYLKESKSIAVPTALTIFAISEVTATVGHNFHGFSHFMHSVVHGGEKFLTAYKVFLSLYKGEYVSAVRDVGIYALGTWLSGGARLAGIPFLPSMAGGLIGLGITFIVFAYDSYAYAKKNAIPMDEFVGWVNKATERNFLEGPYAQTKGMVRIQKGPNGSLPINIKIAPDGKTVSTEYENFQSPEKKDIIETEKQRIDRLNEEFLNTDPNSKWEKDFFSQLQKKECQVLLEIAKKTTQPNGKYNPILNSAPNHIDVGAFEKRYELQKSDTVKDPFRFVDRMGFKVIDSFPFIKFYISKILQDVNEIVPYWSLMDNTKFKRPLNISERTDSYQASSVPNVIHTDFKYTRSNINSTTDLTKILYGTELPSEKYAFLSSGLYRNLEYKLPVKITDKEKVYLIRKKYGLDEVLPGENCCSVFDVPADKNIFPITTNCQYLYDFTSPAFIKKLEEFCGKKEEDKNKENEKKNKTTIDDKKPATTHGQTEEKRAQHAVKMDDARKQDDRRNQKRNTAGYQGTPDSIQNLAQAPRLGVQALIPGNISYDLPITDSESQQRIAFETLDTERDKTSSLIAKIVINLAGNLLRQSISESISPTTIYIRSTPIEVRAGVYSLSDRISDASTKWWRNTGTTYLGKKG